MSINQSAGHYDAAQIASIRDIAARIDDTAGKPTALEPLTKLVLKAARQMTANGTMDETIFKALQKEPGNQQVVDLTVTIGVCNAVVRVLATLQIDVGLNYQPYLQKFPLPAR